MMASSDEQNNRLGMPLGLFVAVRALPVGLLLLCLAGSGLYYHYAQVTEDYRSQHHENTSEHIHTTLVSTLEGTVNQLSEIAGNAIFRNAIVDVERRDEYVPLFLKSLSLAGFSDVPIVLADYKGRLLFANDVPEAQRLLEQTGWQETALRNAQEYVAWGVDGLFVAEPVVVYGSAEAVLMAKLQPAHLESLFKLLAGKDDFLLANDDNIIVYSSLPEQFQTGEIFADRSLPGWHVHVGKTIKRLQFQVFTLENLTERNAFENQLVMLLGLAIVGLLVTAAGIIVATGRGVTGSVQQLSRTFTSILASSAAQLNIRAEVRSNAPRELNNLVLQFNDLIAKVDASTTSKDEVSAILRCLSEMLVVTDAEGAVTWSNKSYHNFLTAIDCVLTGDFHEKSLWHSFSADEDHIVVEVPYPLLHLEGQGRVIIIYWSRAILFNEQGERKGYIYTGQDITQMREVEEDLKEKQIIS